VGVVGGCSNLILVVSSDDSGLITGGGYGNISTGSVRVSTLADEVSV